MAGLQVVPLHSDLEVAAHDGPVPIYEKYGEKAQYAEVAREDKRRICGMRTTTFILAMALIFVIVAAAIGGGIGGTFANLKNGKEYVLGLLA